MRIDFKRLEIHNFMSYQDEIFDLDKNVGMNLICGKNLDIPGSKNGTGKTGLLNSICFALFGQTRNPIKNEHIHNKYIDSKEVRTTLFFDINDKKYKISSGFNKYGSAYCTLSDITEQETDLTKSSIAETRRYLESEILHCDMSIFLRTMILSSDQNYNFFRLKKNDKKQFIEKLFDITVFGDMYSFIHYDINQTDKSLMSLQSSLMILNKQKDQYQTLIDEYSSKQKKLLESLDAQNKEYCSKLNELKNTKVKDNAEEVKKYETASSKISDKIASMRQNMLELSRLAQKIDVKVSKLESQKAQNEEIVSKYNIVLSKLCSKCMPIMEEYFNVGQAKSKIQTLAEEIRKNKSISDEKTQSANELESKMSELTRKLELVDNKIRDLTSEFNKVRLEIERIQTLSDNTSRSIDEEKSKKNPYLELFQKNEADIEDVQNSIDETSEKYAYLKFAESIVSHDTLRKFIIKDLVSILNNSIRHYLSKLGAKYYVVFDENMDYEFMTEGGKYDYDNFSAGERARLMIAACFSFRDFMATKNNLSSNILFLDEFIDGAIDSVAIDATLDILKQYCTTYKQNVYLISHRKEISNDIFDNIIQIVKKNNISKITYLEQQII